MMPKSLRLVLLILGALVIAVAAFWLMYWVPVWLVEDQTGGSLSGFEEIQAIATQRQFVLWTFGGLIAVVGLSYTHLRHALDRDSNRTDRYSTAIGQLSDEKLEIRIGALFALERIALDSRRERGPIMNVLCAFIRVRRRRDFHQLDYVPVDVSDDVAIALEIVGRLPRARSGPTPQLASLDLTGANFRGANLRKADLASSDLLSANLSGADLRSANLGPADSMLIGASLFGADLTRANLSRANLTDADLTDARVAGTRFTKAIVDRAKLGHLDLSGGTPVGLSK